MSKKPTVESKPTTKKERVRALLAPTPTSVADIATALDISKAAAYSLIGDLRRDGATITGMLKEGAMVYSLAKPAALAARVKPFGLKKGDPEQA